MKRDTALCCDYDLGSNIKKTSELVLQRKGSYSVVTRLIDSMYLINKKSNFLVFFFFMYCWYCLSILKVSFYFLLVYVLPTDASVSFQSSQLLTLMLG